jgi:hypothetical protein
MTEHPFLYVARCSASQGWERAGSRREHTGGKAVARRVKVKGKEESWHQLRGILRDEVSR